MIKFYEPKQPYFEFSNYYTHKIVIDGIAYPSSEHYYQSQKFSQSGASSESLEYASIIANAKTPNIARELASQKIKGGYKWRTDLNEIIKKYRGVFVCEAWDDIKDNIMRKVVWHKFNNPKLKDLLLSTGNAKIAENSPRDGYWGIGKDGKGENMLGKILMECRFLLSNGNLGEYELPFQRSNWIIPNVLLASAYPGEAGEKHHSIYNNLISFGINSFVNLMEWKELKKFQRYENVLKEGDICKVENNIFFSSLPIKDRSITTDKHLNDIADAVITLIERKRVILIHCFGGKGRTSTVVSMVLCKLYGMSGKETIELVTKLYEKRPDKGKKPFVIHKTQQNQIIRLCK